MTIIVLANLAQARPGIFADSIAAAMNPRLARKQTAPIEDREPMVTVKIVRLLNEARSDGLSPADFAYVRAGFFPSSAKSYGDELRKLGAVTRMVLLERRELGDDRVYLYDVMFANGQRRLSIALAPDDRVADFQLWEQRP
jgi:hypothetical protein